MRKALLGRHAARAARAAIQAGASGLAFFGALNLLLGLLAGTDRNALWVQGGGTPPFVVTLAVAAFALGQLGGWLAQRARRGLHAVGAWLLAALCALDAARYAELRSTGLLSEAAPLSLSLSLAVWLALTALRGPPAPVASRWRRAGSALLAGGAGVALVLAHLLSFGATDYRRPADAAVVFGSAVRADGSPSGSLRDRTLTACDLYRRGLVHTLVLSGGRDPAVPLSEPACMAQIALAAGVPAEALVLDEQGRTSDATLAALPGLARAHGWGSLLLVSHDYHLARLALLARSHGLTACTVPTRETSPWPSKHRFVLREVVAFGWHFLRTAL